MDLEGEMTSIQITKTRLNGLKYKAKRAKRVFASYYLDDLLEQAKIPNLPDEEAMRLGVKV